MSYVIDRINNPAAIFVKLNADFDVKTELSAYLQDLVNALEQELTPLSIIIDILEYSISLDELMSIAKQMMGDLDNPYQHRNTTQLILVTQSKFVKLSLDGFGKFGIVNTIKVADSVDDAKQMV